MVLRAKFMNSIKLEQLQQQSKNLKIFEIQDLNENLFFLFSKHNFMHITLKSTTIFSRAFQNLSFTLGEEFLLHKIFHIILRRK